MAHISSIGAGLFSDLSVAVPATDFTATTIALMDSAAEFQSMFAAEIASDGGTKVGDASNEVGGVVTPGAGATFVRIKNVREFPAMGTPPNVVNVPVYGQKTSSQIQGQADAPSIEITMNYVAEDWKDAAGNILGEMVGDGTQYLFRFALLNSEPDGYADTAGEIGTVQNTSYYWFGKLEALQVSPQLTDANTATITITVQSDFYGAYTV